MGGSVSFTEAPSVGSCARDADRVDGFLGIGAGFSVVAFFCFLDVREQDPVQTKLSPILFMVSFMSLINPPGCLADGPTESSLESSPWWGTFRSSSLDSSLPSESCSSSSFAVGGDLSSSGEVSFSVVLEMGLSSSTSDPLSSGSADFGRSFGYLNPILGIVRVQ